MQSSWLLIFAAAMVALEYVNGGSLTFEQMCQKHKDHGLCDNNPTVQKRCSKICNGDSAPAPPVTDENPTTTQKPTTQKSGNNNQPNKNCNKRSPCVPVDTANAAFRKRCEATDLKPSCFDHCRYDEDAVTMRKAFLGGPCPLAQLRTYLKAASNNKDNTGCCQDTGILQKKTAICGCFCFPTGPVWPEKSETSKYAPCATILTGIMQCHYFAEGAD